MKRHNSLIPLSREHHLSLILAQLLKLDAPVFRGLPTSIEEKAIYAQSFFRTHLVPHFEKEELMLEKVKGVHPSIDAVITEIQEEHRQLSSMFLTLNDHEVTPERNDAIGNALDDHIRKEERILFPLIQEHCDEALLLTLELE